VSAPLRLARFADRERTFHALLEDDDRAREIRGDPIQDRPAERGGGPAPLDALLAAAGPSLPTAGLRWLAPCLPSKIVGVGRNYRDHAAELGHAIPGSPLLFLKPPSAVLPHGGVIRLPAESRRVDFEGELAVVIGRTARAVPEDRALDHVLGYTCLNDVTARDLQASDVQFTRAKGFDTFCPVGPCIALGLEPAALVIETFVNGAPRQSAPASGMIFGVARLVSFISRVMTLLPGDLIATGTPEGVGPLGPGDEVSVAIAGIGRLTNRVEAL
jgi:2-keto-4-pentenoate hydratase/2-oxohepta-3-ene-1,7-dioic acid hydratase in catechol pathway